MNYSVVATCFTNSGQNLVRYEVFANFNGATDSVLNVFNFQALGGWAGHVDAACGFWHKDNNDTSPGVLSQEFGTWAPQLTGNAITNRPSDSFLLIGGNPVAANTTTADPSFTGGGSNPQNWNRAQLPPHYSGGAGFNDLGWFNASPPNLQGRVGVAPNTATQVKLGQFILSQGDTALRTYTLRIAVNNATASSPVFSDGSFTFGSLGTLWYRDLDGDGFGAASSGTTIQCTQPAGYVLNNTDCNDANIAINPNTIWYADLDGDGFGASDNGTLTQCAQPAGYVLNNTDNCPSVANPTQLDCNANGLGDACEIASGAFADCDGDGTLDICEGAVIVAASSPLLAPFGNGFPATYTFTNLPKAYRGTPTFTIEATSDLNSSNEFIGISFDGGGQEFFFVATGSDCPATPDIATRTFTVPALNALIGDGALAITLIASGTVDAAQCAGGGVRVWLNYDGLPASSDCNNNGTLDSCEIGTGAALDCNGNGIPDSCDISSGFALDCNSNSKPDTCDIATGPSTDLNSNGVPDECSTEFVVGGSGYSNITTAINAAPNGATIHVAAGTYNSSTIVTSKQIHLRSISGPATTILSGTGLTTSILAFNESATIGSSISGFTLRDGETGYNFAGFLVGGAIACMYSTISVDNCIFDNNHANSGGAIYSFGSATQVTNSIFTNNDALDEGGAVQFAAGNGWLVANCSFTNNGARLGGAMHVWSTSGTIRDCEFTNNTASELGGVLSFFSPDSGSVLLDGCTLEANSADIEGGGIYVYEFTKGVIGDLQIINSRLCRNSPENVVGPVTDLGGNTFSGDCNENGICDADEIASGAQVDCNGNGLLDSCELNGSVIGWGEDSYGQATPTTQLGSVLQVAAGCSHAMALKSNGTISAWGFNTFGQINVPAGLTGVTQISAGCDHNAALRSNGTVAAWGYNQFGQCDVPAAVTGVTQVSAGGNHTAARKSDGTIAVWGRDVSGESTIPGGIGAAAEVILGGAHSIARRANGTIVCWGLNNFGQCTVPGNVGTLSSVVAGCYHTAGLRTDGTVVCWGSNIFNQCAVPAGLSGVVKLAAGIGQHTVALKADGSLKAWGWNGFGQTNVPMNLAPISLISAGGTHTIVGTRGAADCNTNGIIDSCDIAAGGFADCDGDGVLDVCEISAMPSLDCNGNGVLNSCEIAAGAADCNSNGRPDTCDLAAATSSDLNSNGVPDECSGEFVVGGTGFADIQAAINAAPNGTTIHIAPGTYNAALFVQAKQVHLRSINGPATTILSGSGLTTSILAFNESATIGSSISGFTLRDGETGYNFAGFLVGGAIACMYSTISVDNCIFDNNHANSGGAIYSFGSATQVTNSIFTNNDALDEGGAVQFAAGNGWLVANCSFTNNGARLGGAMHVWNTSGTIRDSAFTNNTASDKGGVLTFMSWTSGRVRLDGCTLEANIGFQGGGIYVGIFATGITAELELLDTRLCRNEPNNIVGPFINLGGNTLSQDCNANGLCDSDEIASGSALDCNANGFPDSCDIAAGTSSDCNDNLIPDSCDIASGNSTDVDSNGVPDECKPDCDNDGLPDAWELMQGLDNDCNANAIIDRCEIAQAPSLDCNGNIALDSCEIAANPALDCDSDGAIDTCEIAANPSLDCNGDAALDNCQLAGGALRDCDNNGHPDICDIAEGAEDKNSNGHLDTCELARGDLNLDGAISAGDLAVLLSFWGAVNPPVGDLTGDGLITADDLALMLGNWGTPP